MLRRNRMLYRLMILVLLLPMLAQAQETTPQPDSLLQDATLENVVQYALKHQPLVQQALIDEQITEKTIQGKLADWYPPSQFRLQLPAHLRSSNQYYRRYASEIRCIQYIRVATEWYDEPL